MLLSEPDMAKTSNDDKGLFHDDGLDNGVFLFLLLNIYTNLLLLLADLPNLPNLLNEGKYIFSHSSSL